MITPKFEISQDEEFIFLKIYAPFTKISEAEFFIECDNICFYSKPYYLRLHLPGRLADDDKCEAKYDVENGLYTANITKETKGEMFEGLEMLTKLLTPPDSSKNKYQHVFLEEICRDGPSSEVTETSAVIELDAASSSSEALLTNNLSERSVPERHNFYENVNDLNFDWYFPQDFSKEDISTVLTDAKYGFALKLSGLSHNFSEFDDIFDVKQPDKLIVVEKKLIKSQHEYEHFSKEHYLADLYLDEDDSMLTEILDYQPWWRKSIKQCKICSVMKDYMIKFPKRKYAIDDEIMPLVLYGLVDIIYAYSYNYRILLGEVNVESSWTISKIAATLSWLYSFSSLQEVIVSCYRRSLIFPLHRNWKLCEKILQDVLIIISGGKKPILKCLLCVYDCILHNDLYYIFNDMYIVDYCIWIQSVRSEIIESLVGSLKLLRVTKEDIALDLVDLETAAELVVKENIHSGIQQVVSGLSNMNCEKYLLDSDDNSESCENFEASEDENDIEECESEGNEYFTGSP